MAGKKKTDTAEGFVGSVFQYSISTFVNIGIMAVAIIITGVFIDPFSSGQMGLFNKTVNTIMTIAILGLDQSLMRFYHKPPTGLTHNGLFRICFYFSSAALIIGGSICSTMLLGPIYAGIGFKGMGPVVIPMAFLNAFFFMVARYFNVLYRMENNILLYTVQSVLMQFFFRLFYLLGYSFGFGNPVLAMAVCSIIGLGGFTLVFSFLRRNVLRPREGEFTREAYGVVLPYGFAIAPTAVFVTLNAIIPDAIIGNFLETTKYTGQSPVGIFGFTYTLSNVVTLIQGGFASFWGPYMFQNHRTDQQRIKNVHDYLNFVLLSFFCALVAFEDVAFIIFRNYAEGQAIFPMMMLGAVFTILCETTVYGNAIAKRPIYDTIGIGISFAVNLVLGLLLIPVFGLYGAALAVALSNMAMFLFRSFTAQRFYKSIPSIKRTVTAISIAVAVAAAGTLLNNNFVAKGLVCLAAIAIYCIIYNKQLVRLWKLGLSILQGLLDRRKT